MGKFLDATSSFMSTTSFDVKSYSWKFESSDCSTKVW